MAEAGYQYKSGAGSAVIDEHLLAGARRPDTDYTGSGIERETLAQPCDSTNWCPLQGLSYESPVDADDGSRKGAGVGSYYPFGHGHGHGP